MSAGTKASQRSSFFWPMQCVSGPRRRAMAAIYGFCRAVDDIADGAAPMADKTTALERWEQELTWFYQQQQSSFLPLPLQQAILSYQLPQGLFLEIIAGMRMDIDQPLYWPDDATLSLYCHRVAGCVGLLAIRIFGCTNPASETVAKHLGQALQRINILRDIHADAGQGRVYLPRDYLLPDGRYGMPDPSGLPPHQWQHIWSEMRRRIHEELAQAVAAITPTDRMALFPAFYMAHIYAGILSQMVKIGADSKPVMMPRTSRISLIVSAYAAFRTVLIRRF